MRRSLPLVTLLLLGASVASLGCSSAGAPVVSANRTGLDNVSTIKFPTASGSQNSLGDYRGRVVMLHFFASWCRECGMEAPALRNLANSFSGSEFSIVGVAIDDDPFAMQTFAARYSIPFSILIDSNDELREFFQIRELPVTVFLDRNGVPVRFKDPDSGETTSKIVGARMWDTVAPVQMIAGLVESGR